MLDLSSVFATFPVLETERFVLRAIRPDDVDDIFTLLSDDRVARYLPDPPYTTVEQAQQRMRRFKNQFEDQIAIPWIISPRETGRLIGTCTLFSILTAHYRAEIGYMILPSWWRKGAVTEVASAVLDYAFDAMNLHSVEARIDPENIASKSLLAKLSFVQEGYFREDFYDIAQEKFADTAVFSLLKAIWLARES